MIKKNISFRRQMQQRVKGTHDSPCISVCTHKQGDWVCAGCGMLKEEKKGWKRNSDARKREISEHAKARLVSLLDVSSRFE